MSEASLDPPDQTSLQPSATERSQSISHGAKGSFSQILPECLMHKIMRWNKTVVVLIQGLANFFYKGPDGKYCKFCGPCHVLFLFVFF